MALKIRLMRKIRSLRRRGFLTREQLVVLEEASQRPFRVRKPAQKFMCSECSYEWFYKSVKCPTCSSLNVKAA